MKNKIILILLFNVLISVNLVKAQELYFESEKIISENENLIIATGSVKVINENLYEVTSEKLTINRNNKIYSFSDNVVFKNNDQSQIIKSNFLKLDQKNNIYELKKNIEFIDLKKKINLFADSVSYNQSNELIIFTDNVKVIIDKEIIIKSDLIVYDNSKKELNSKNQTIITDNLGNQIQIEKFIYKLNEKKLIGSDARIIDKEKNIYEIKDVRYDIGKKEIYGKDVALNSNNEIKNNKKNISRSKSRAIIIKDDQIKFDKSVYTNCNEYKNKNCSPWLLKAKNITHDKRKKIVKYDNVILKLYNLPIIYFPKFFHPDPTVNRQSGFLMPTISSRKNGSFIQAPYFFAINDSSDLTFSPRFYDNGNNLYQTEVRKITKNSSSIIDLSLLNDKNLIQNNKFTDSHFFLNSKVNLDLINYDKSFLDIKIETASNDNYLKSKNIESPIINSQTLLSSNLSFKGYNDTTEILLSTEIFKDLNKEADNDGYEYILPNIEISKKYDFLKLFNPIELNTKAYNKIYNTDVNEKVLINNLNYKTSNFTNNFGFINNYEFLFKNFNSEAKNSSIYKDKTSNNFQTMIQFNSKLPLQNKGENFDQISTPKLSIKLNPSKNKNIRSEDRLVTFDNIFLADRLGSNEILEGGMSITLGNEYKIFNKKNQNHELFAINLATSIRANENEDLPNKSSLGDKTSNFTGNSSLKLNNLIDLDYDFLLDNDLKELKYHKIKSNLKINNFVTKFEFLEENNEIGDESFISNESSIQLNENKSLLFRTRQNKKINLTEYYDLIYQYKIDCLTAELKYNKSYYNDGALKPEEGIYFSLTFMPLNNSVNLPGIK